MLRWTMERLYDRLLPAIFLLRLCGWWVTRPITLGVRVVAIDGDQILLVRAHGRSQWHLPGGAVGRGEQLVDAARREVDEEAGCAIEIERLLGMYANFREFKSDHIAIFVGRPISPLDPRLNIEIAEARYFPLGALPAALDPAVVRRLADLEASRWGMHGPW